MRAHLALVAFALALASITAPAVAGQPKPSNSCGDYDAWEWAQSELDRVPSLASGLDPDGNGVACDGLPHGGFAPAWWTETIPATTIPAELISIVDGDTLVADVNGVQDEVRFYRSDAPEVAGCGGDAATEFLQMVFRYNDENLTFHIEKDLTDRDRYDRLLAYVWITVDGKPYLLNEVLERSGWARDVDYGDRIYENQLAMATQFAEKHQIGQYAACGGFTAEDIASGGTNQTPGSGQANQQPTQVPQGPSAGQCDPSYPDVCIPPIEVTGDLDCGQIEHTHFRVLPPDPHNLDGDHDGEGCEGAR